MRVRFRLVACLLMGIVALLAACANSHKKEHGDRLPDAVVRVTLEDSLGKETLTDPAGINNLLTLLRAAESVPQEPPSAADDVKVDFVNKDGTVTRLILHEGQVWDPRGVMLVGPSVERFAIAVEAMLGGGAVLAERVRGAASVSLVAADEQVRIELTEEQRDQLAGYVSQLRRAHLDNPLGGAHYPDVRILLQDEGADAQELRLMTPVYGLLSERRYALPSELWPSAVKWLDLQPAKTDQLSYLFQASKMWVSADLGEIDQPMKQAYTFDTTETPTYTVKVHHVIRLLREGEPGSVDGQETEVLGTLGFSVRGEVREVTLSRHGFSYNGQSYRLADLTRRIRKILAAG